MSLLMKLHKIFYVVFSEANVTFFFLSSSSEPYKIFLEVFSDANVTFFFSSSSESC